MSNSEAKEVSHPTGTISYPLFGVELPDRMLTYKQAAEVEEISEYELASIAAAAEAQIGHENPEFNQLIQEALSNEVKIDTEKVLRIWKVPNRHNIPALKYDIIWVEEGIKEKGYRHIWEKKRSLVEMGVAESKLLEVRTPCLGLGEGNGALQSRALRSSHCQSFEMILCDDFISSQTINLVWVMR